MELDRTCCFYLVSVVNAAELFAVKWVFFILTQGHCFSLLLERKEGKEGERETDAGEKHLLVASPTLPYQGSYTPRLGIHRSGIQD